MGQELWRAIAEAQEDLISLRQLRRAGVTRSTVRNQVAAGRWARRTELVLSTTTGHLTERQRMWLGVLHCGNGALVGGLAAAGLFGLRNWERPDVTILVPDEWAYPPLPGVETFRTRRSLTDLGTTRVRGAGRLPVCRLEPALLLFAGYDPSPRTAQGVVAAAVQQRLTTPDELRRWIDQLRPLPRAKLLRRALLDIEGGAQSLAEIDVRRMCRRCGLPAPTRQRPRRDREGRLRFTDCEWQLVDGTVIVLEVDGGFHAEVGHYDLDLRRQRKLTSLRRIVLRASAWELREEPEVVAEDLRALGVGRLSA